MLLPDPLGPSIDTNSPELDVEVDVVEGQDRCAPPHVAALHAPQLVERRRSARSGGRPRSRVAGSTRRR